MQTISIGAPILYHFVILGLCAYLLISGITHTFVCLFAAGSLIELIRGMAFFLMSIAPGGFSANAHYLPVIAAVGFLGMLLFVAGFFSLTAYLLRAPASQA